MATTPPPGVNTTVTDPAEVQAIAFTRCCMRRLPLDHDILVGTDTITLTARRMTGSEPGSVLAAVIARRSGLFGNHD
ncbi:MAG TPA: hypothetical protein PLV41_08485 [Miltoncostaeales bacterium]|jgi:hypothetical protein|nr:hypothetical protein [Miltoncostaeales bacterium]